MFAGILWQDWMHKHPGHAILKTTRPISLKNIQVIAKKPFPRSIECSWSISERLQLPLVTQQNRGSLTWTILEQRQEQKNAFYIKYIYLMRFFVFIYFAEKWIFLDIWLPGPIISTSSTCSVYIAEVTDFRWKIFNIHCTKNEAFHHGFLQYWRNINNAF